MARYVDVASLRFDRVTARSCASARQAVFDRTQSALDALRGYGLDLIVLCEAVESLGQRMDDAETISRPGPLLSLYLDYAAKEKCHIAGSLKTAENGRVFNSLVFVSPQGVLGVYHKSNLTQGEIEMGLTTGAGATVFDSAIGRFGGVICFDLNFEWLRDAYVSLKPDILCFSSMYHGGLMQSAWAYRCRSFFVSALPFDGCGTLDPHGCPLALSDCYTASPRVRINLDRVMVHLDYNDTKFAMIEKKYRHEVAIVIPPNIGSALIYSLSVKRSALEIARAFDLELLDDYFARMETANKARRDAV